jgi:6-phosphogluconolactonase
VHRFTFVAGLFFASSAIGCSSPDDAVGEAPDGSTPALDGAPTGDAAIAPGGDGGDAGDASDSPNGPLVAYASGYGPNIALFAVDPLTGALTSKKTFPSFGASPSFLAVSRDAKNLYALNEGNPGRIGAYTIDQSSGALTYVNDVSSTGNGPAYVAVDATGKYVVVANYGDGTVAVLPVQAGGGLGNATDTKTVGANAHMVALDPSNKFAFVPCLGVDYVAPFKFDAGIGKLVPNGAHIPTTAGAGPRHLAFHPAGKLAYLINETNSTLTAFTLDGTSGLLTEVETKSTLPVGFSGANTGAEVWVHPSGGFVYVSNRGDDSIGVFAIDQVTGKMTLRGHTKTGGTMPRDFTLDPTGTFLYAANQGSSAVVPFRIDPAQGTLSLVAAQVSVPSVSFVGIVRLPK